MITREQTKKIKIGSRVIGGGNPVAIQSMTNTRTEDVAATVGQILALEKAGCEIIRCAVPTMEAAESLAEIKKQIHIPLVADIHFDYRLAIAAIEHGADKIRINPGNIGDETKVRAVVEKAKAYKNETDNFFKKLGCEGQDGAFMKITDEEGIILPKVLNYSDVIGKMMCMSLDLPERYVVHKGKYAVRQSRQGEDMHFLDARNLYLYAFIYGPHSKSPNFSFTLDMK